MNSAACLAIFVSLSHFIAQSESENTSKNPDHVHFYSFLDNSDPGHQCEIVYNDPMSLYKAGLKRNGKIRFIIHGFRGTYADAWPLKNAFLKREYKNTICVDWGNLSGSGTTITTDMENFVLYHQVKPATAVVGKRIAEMLIFMMEEGYIDTFHDVQLIGFSLGSHISGAASFYIKQLTGKLLGRITGLDPAGPLFGIETSPDDRLTTDDADFVDVIHTNAGEQLSSLGTNLVVGDVDFFANGGSKQPVCEGSPNALLCNHVQAVNYYQRAILKEHLVGCICKYENKSTPYCPKPEHCDPKAKFGFPLTKSYYGRTYYLHVPLNPPPKIEEEYEPSS